MKLSERAVGRIWIGVGWFGVALLVYLSLTPTPPEIPVEQGDKIGHVAAYAVLMLWWAQLSLTSKRGLIAFGLLAMGVALEFVQGWTGYRTFEYADMGADLAGILLGWTLAPPRLPNLLALSKHWLAR